MMPDNGPGRLAAARDHLEAALAIRIVERLAVPAYLVGDRTRPPGAGGLGRAQHRRMMDSFFRSLLPSLRR
jgi:hypothetical protein